MRFGKTEILKEKFYAGKKPIKICDVNVDDIVILNLVNATTNSKYLTGYLNKDMRPLILIMPEMSRYVNTFKVKDKIHKDDENLLEKI